MRQAITTGRRHGETKFGLVYGPETKIGDQLKAFKAAKVKGVHADYAELQLWTSDAGRVSKFFPTKLGEKPKPFVAFVNEPTPKEKKAPVAETPKPK